MNDKDELFDDLVIYDLAFGLDENKCPNCAEIIPSSMILDDEVECPKCGQKFKK